MIMEFECTGEGRHCGLFRNVILQIAHMGEMRSSYRIFVGKPEGKRPLGRPKRRWEDNGR
jgi:hypothetical protein